MLSLSFDDYAMVLLSLGWAGLGWGGPGCSHAWDCHDLNLWGSPATKKGLLSSPKCLWFGQCCVSVTKPFTCTVDFLMSHTQCPVIKYHVSIITLHGVTQWSTCLRVVREPLVLLVLGRWASLEMEPPWGKKIICFATVTKHAYPSSHNKVKSSLSLIYMCIILLCIIPRITHCTLEPWMIWYL
jgi:hypothetical protein